MVDLGGIQGQSSKPAQEQRQELIKINELLDFSGATLTAMDDSVKSKFFWRCAKFDFEANIWDFRLKIDANLSIADCRLWIGDFRLPIFFARLCSIQSEIYNLKSSIGNCQLAIKLKSGCTSSV